MKLKKILSLITLCGFIIVNAIPYAQALENPKYKFLDGGQPRWVDMPYEQTLSLGEKTLSLTGSIYATYNNSLINYVQYGTRLSKESSYNGLAGWDGIIFIEPKKLKQGVNHVLSSRLASWSSYIKNEYKSPFGVDIICGESGECTMNAYAGLDWDFQNYSNSYLRGKVLDWGSMTLVKNFNINRNTSPDFLIYVSINYSRGSYNEELKTNTSRVILQVDTETEPGSGKLNKPTDATRITGFFPFEIQRENGIGNMALDLQFLQYRNAYSIDRYLLYNDLSKIGRTFGNGNNHNFFETYYNSMKTNIYAYLLELGFSARTPTKDEIKDFSGNSLNPIENDEDITLKDCEGLDVGCHIGNLSTTIKAGFFGITSKILEGIKSIFSWIWQNIKGYLEPFIKPIYDFIMKLIEEGKIIFEKLKTFFTEIYEIIKNLFKGGTDPTIAHNTLTPGAGFRASFNQELLCEKNILKNDIKKDNGMIEFGLSIIKGVISSFTILDPTAPTNGTEICTYEGIKTLHLRKNSFIDLIITMIFSMMSFLIFYKINNS